MLSGAAQLSFWQHLGRGACHPVQSTSGARDWGTGEIPRYPDAVAGETRRHPRLSIEAKADIIGTEVVLGRPLADLSLGGCRFDGAAWETTEQSLELVLSFPGAGAHLPLGGVVVRSTGDDMGVRFDNLSEEQKWALRKHIRELNDDKT
jgi:hypothetical protein